MRILLVEDERDLSKAVKKVLELSGYEVDQAFDGAIALGRLKEKKYDCVVLDVMMPRVDGFQVVATMRQDGDPTPVLMLTARAEIDDKVLGLDSGADDYLTKPFQSKELLARIRALLRRNAESFSAYSIGNLTLRPETSELSAVTSIRLTNTEYRLMETLVTHQDALLSTERLMDAVWDYDSEAGINVVWAYISSLRKKLTQIGANVTLKAVRGVGYRLEVNND